MRAPEAVECSELGGDDKGVETGEHIAFALEEYHGSTARIK